MIDKCEVCGKRFCTGEAVYANAVYIVLCAAHMREFEDRGLDLPLWQEAQALSDERDRLLALCNGGDGLIKLTNLPGQPRIAERLLDVQQQLRLTLRDLNRDARQWTTDARAKWLAEHPEAGGQAES